jgi:hypothetical protein
MTALEESERCFQGMGTNFIVKRGYDAKKHDELARLGRDQPDVDFLHNEIRLRMSSLSLFNANSLTYIVYL